MCHQTFQRPSKSFGTSLSDDSGLRFSKTWRYLRLQIFLSREGKIVNLHLKNNWNSNFTKLSTAETKILTTSQTKKMHKPGGLLVLGFLQARDRFYWPRAPDHRLISKTATPVMLFIVNMVKFDKGQVWNQLWMRKQIRFNLRLFC